MGNPSCRKRLLKWVLQRLQESRNRIHFHSGSRVSCRYMNSQLILGWGPAQAKQEFGNKRFLDGIASILEATMPDQLTEGLVSSES